MLKNLKQLLKSKPLSLLIVGQKHFYNNIKNIYFEYEFDTKLLNFCTLLF